MPSVPGVRALTLLAIACASLLWSCNCGNQKLIETACRDDSQCPDGQICDEFRCLPAAAKACSVVTDGTPILQADPYSVSLGALDEPEANQVITLHNIGNCTLTLFEAKLAKGADSPGFLCEFCNGNFPIEIFPGRSIEMAIDFQQKAVGAVSDELDILSDDKQFPDMRIPLSANYLGQPRLVVTPNPVDFGYVAQGRQGTVALQLTNQGTGVAPITVQSIDFSDSTSMDFSLVAPFTDPVVLHPITPETRDILPLELRYTPRTPAKHHIELWVHTNKGVITVPVDGDALTPPKVTYAPMMINLGDVPLGRTNLKPLTLTNMAGAALDVSWAWGGATPNTDLFTTPTTTQPIAGGLYTEVQVGFTATAIGPATGLLNFTTNDPSRTSFSVPVTANGVMGAGAEVVKIDMTFDNGSDGTFDNDVRNVDMTLEHPFGYVCNKQNPNPMNWGSYGKPSWLAFAPKEEPERIVLADGMTDGTYRVQLTYMEDCNSIPTGLLAGLLGISTSALVGYFSGGAIPLDPSQVSMLVQQVCLGHSSTSATVTVYVNGVVKKEKTITLGSKGQSTYALDLIRTNGTFDAQ